MRNCPYCAEEIDDDALFCKYCGREAGPLPAASAEDEERNLPPQPAVEFAAETVPLNEEPVTPAEPSPPVKPAPTPLSRTLPYILILVFVLCILLGVLPCVISGITSVFSGG